MPIDHRRLAAVWAVAFVLVNAVFLIWPGLDLAVSGLFYDGETGFFLAPSTTLEVIRQAIWRLSVVLVLACLAVVIWGLIFRARRPDLRAPLFIVLLYLLGPVLLVDGLLKRFSGRARPANVEVFGGPAQFTPPLMPADQCAHNCSFVSGEGAAATAVAISLAVLAPFVRRATGPGWYRAYLVLAVVVPLTGMVLRVATGRHFLSDTLDAALFVGLIALGLHRLLLAPRHG